MVVHRLVVHLKTSAKAARQQESPHAGAHSAVELGLGSSLRWPRVHASTVQFLLRLV